MTDPTIYTAASGAAFVIIGVLINKSNATGLVIALACGALAAWGGLTLTGWQP